MSSLVPTGQEFAQGVVDPGVRFRHGVATALEAVSDLTGREIGEDGIGTLQCSRNAAQVLVPGHQSFPLTPT